MIGPLAASFLLSAAIHAHSVVAVAGYHIHHVLAAPALRGEARLELLEDERLDPGRRAALDSLYSVGGRPCEGQTAAILASLCASVVRLPLRPAIVRLVNGTGRETGRLALERSTAELSRLAVGAHDSMYAVRVDLSADMGSYSGPLVRFVSVEGGRLGWVRATDDATGHRSELDLATTLKTAWRTKSEAGRAEILLVACRPDLTRTPAAEDRPRFVITYSRFYLARGRWHRADRRTAGIWENDGAFPARASFP